MCKGLSDFFIVPVLIRIQTKAGNVLEVTRQQPWTAWKLPPFKNGQFRVE